VTGIATIITEQLWALAVVVNENVQIPIIVEVANSGTPAHAWQLDVRSKAIADVLENAMPHVAEHQLGFSVTGIGVVAFNVVKDVAVRHKEIASAIVVVIHEACPERADMVSRVSNF
jgi:hypothetical protein